MRKIGNHFKMNMRGYVLAVAAAALLSGCGGAKDGAAENEPVSTAAETAEPAGETAAGTAEEGGTAGETAAGAAEEGGTARDGKASAQSESPDGGTSADGQETEQHYGVMYANVADVRSDESGASVYSLQDLNDPENIWTLSDLDIGSILADMEKGSRAAFLFSGDMENNADSVSFIAAVPYGDYRIAQAEGVTLNNTMSTFTLRTDSGEELSFLKDNCKMEPDSLTKSEGDRILVYYAQGGQEPVCYPLEIFAAD